MSVRACMKPSALLWSASGAEFHLPGSCDWRPCLHTQEEERRLDEEQAAAAEVERKAKEAARLEERKRRGEERAAAQRKRKEDEKKRKETEDAERLRIEQEVEVSCLLPFVD